MRKIIIYIILFIVLMFVLPVLFTPRFKIIEVGATISHNQEKDNSVVNTNELQPNEVKIIDYDYSKYKTVKLLHSNTGDIEEIKLDEYLCNVVSAEMPVDFEMEALKAQAVVARTYTMYKIIHNAGKHEGADICDSASCCQAWVTKDYRLSKWDEDKKNDNWNKICTAVNETIGKIITYNNEPINAFFHSNSGGTTEIPLNVWGGSGYPYLQVVETLGEDEYSQYKSELVISNQELLSKLKEKYNDIQINFDELNSIEVLERTESGRVRTIKFGNKNLSGVETRTILGLRSTNFEVITEGENIKFNVIGYGHGVGMSQTGADALAKQGYNFEDIIKHFYTGVEIVNM